VTTSPAHVLVVDDEPMLRRVLVRILSGAGYRCSEADGVPAARRVLDDAPVDLVLSDVNMPGENGFALLRWISENHPRTGVIMVTALADVRAAEPAAQYGALGYVLKPFEASEILINVATALTRQAREHELDESTRLLRKDAEERAGTLEEAVSRLALSEQTVQALHEEVVLRLATVAEWRDPCTGQHLQSMSTLSGQLARAAGLGTEQVESVRVASLLHDIGKVAVPDSILLTAGPLTVEERAVMQEHSATGAAMLRGSSMEILRLGSLISLTHHERWDGTGYPQGLAGTAIPIEARIVSIADVYDALCSERPYTAAGPVERVVATMIGGRGTQFDPELLDVFLADVVA
jgi:putative two-component system response regulator